MKLTAALKTGWTKPIPYKPIKRNKDESKEAFDKRAWAHKASMFPNQNVRGFVEAENEWFEKSTGKGSN